MSEPRLPEQHGGTDPIGWPVPALFPTTVVGSLPRPRFLKDIFDDFHEGKVTAAARERMLDGAVPSAIALQEAAGVDIISDGEWRRFSYVAVICDIASGFSRGLSGSGQDGKYWHTVTGEVRSLRPGLLAEDARFALQCSLRPLKVALPSPYLLSVRMWDPVLSKDAYPTREDFARALVPVLRDEVRALRDAGVHTVQIDDPHLCLFVDDEVRARFPDADAEAMHCVGLINAVFDGVTGVNRAVHLCRRNKGRKGWVGQGGYDKILGPLRALAVDQLMMEFSIPAAGDMKSLGDLPNHVTVGLGCVDCRGEHIEGPEIIAARVEEAMKYVAKERIVLAPDCGFAPGNAADIPVDEAYVKLRNMAQAARMLRERHGLGVSAGPAPAASPAAEAAGSAGDIEVELDRVSRRFSPDGGKAARPALASLSLGVRRGELLVLVGPSGCGKSTTLRLVAGLDDPDEGEVTIGGRSMRGVAPQERDVAMVFQGYALYPHMTARQILEFPLKMRGVGKAERERAVEDAARALSLGPLLGRRPDQLSGGERQRVAMGRAIVRKPRVFLFDEPLSNLDAALRGDIRLEIGALVRRLGATALYVTHDHVEAMTLADRIAVLRAGELLQVDSPRALYESPASSFVGAFLGSPRMNLLPARVSGDSLLFGPFRLPLPAGAGAMPGALEVGLRPEALRLTGDEGGARGVVMAVEPLGPETHLVVEAGGERLRLRCEGFARPSRGEPVGLGVSGALVHVFDPARGGARISSFVAP